jgi:alpha-galactosidase
VRISPSHPFPTFLDVSILAWNAYRVRSIISVIPQGAHCLVMQCDINETVILETARLMKSHGLLVSISSDKGWSHGHNSVFQDIGYDHVNVDDCYSEKKRSSSGDIVASTSFGCLQLPSGSLCTDKTKFPSGMRSMTDKIHGLGL